MDLLVIVVGVLLVALIAAALLVLVAMARAPFGYQDKDGFHYEIPQEGVRRGSGTARPSIVPGAKRTPPRHAA